MIDRIRGATVAEGPGAMPSTSSLEALLALFRGSARRAAELRSGAAAQPAPVRTGYVSGCFDLFHPGHIEILRAAKVRRLAVPHAPALLHVTCADLTIRRSATAFWLASRIRTRQ